MSDLPRIFVLTVDRQIARFDRTAKHMDDLGIKWERLNGFDNTLCELSPIRTFDLDRAGERIGKKHICATLTHYLCWFLMSYQPDDYFIVFEYDVSLPDNFEQQWGQVLSDLPDDWDIAMIGSCCAEGRTTQLKGNIWEGTALCGHAMAYRKKALPVLLREHQSIYQPLDVALMLQSMPKLKTYVIRPAIVGQHGTPLPP